jgi:hypothetical protein
MVGRERMTGFKLCLRVIDCRTATQLSGGEQRPVKSKSLLLIDFSTAKMLSGEEQSLF